MLRSVSPTLLVDLANQGLLGMQIAEVHGGLGLGHFATARVLEQLAALDMSASLFVGLNNYLGIGPIARFGGATLQQALLPRLARGRELAAFALAEPGVGTSPDAFVAYAERVNCSGWKLYGSKQSSASTLGAAVTNVFVRHKDQQGVSAFVVPHDAPGLSCTPRTLRAGSESLTSSTLLLDGVMVSDERLLGHVGQGTEIALEAVMHSRLAIAATCLGGMKRCAQLVFRYATQRRTPGGTLVAHPVTLSKLGRVTAGVTALQSLVQRIANALDAGDSVPADAYTVCKIAAPEMLWQAADDLVQLLGRRGYHETSAIRDLTSDARALRSYEGPTEAVSAMLGSRFVSGGEEAIKTVVRNTLRAPETLDLIPQALKVVRERLAADTGGKNPDTAYWIHSRTGELVMWIVLLAAVEGQRAVAATPDLERAATWARANFERMLTQVSSRAPPEATSDGGAVANAVASYSQTIGDIDPVLFWQEQIVHPLLSPQADPRPSSPRSIPPVEVSMLTEEAAGVVESPAPSSHRRRDELRTWVVSWLSRKLRVVESQIDPRRSFADHGLDSLAAVELAKSLSDHLNWPLDETLLWNFATIDALVDYLDGAGPVPEDRRFTNPATGSATQAAADDDENSLEGELVRLERELKRR
jgi:alkylation response protein AidB-like acyl-CoA dehydrogenase/acyl carrier protein